ncbi:enoyl-CoA hydratase/isomerase family protein [bacterium]|nr:enoyl-CoA hydratase/isomerase family protein [bacterium]
MPYENLTLEFENGIALLTIARPKALNALSNATLDEMESALDEIERNESARAVVITGSGEKSFVAGADISEIHKLDAKSGLAYSERGNALFYRIETFSRPVVAAVNGFALGGGCELSMACHVRLASEKAKFGQPEIGLGIIPGFGGTQRLPRLIGPGRALDLLMTGRMIDAATALAWGLVTEIIAPENLLSRAKELAAQLGAKPRVALTLIREAVRVGVPLEIGDALRVEADLFSKSCGTYDKTEGTAAFLEKREAHFRGN